jgi:hypothetical protein
MLAGAGYYLFTSDRRQVIDRVYINLTRAHYLFRYHTGLPLPGTPDLASLLGVPVYRRIFKLESELELWVQKEGRFVRIATYPICFWSGRLGPKLKEGDAQAPEGFYTVSAMQLNPNSRWYRSFNLGYPNVFDLSYGRTGSFLMVHGGCGSIGCYAVTNPVIGEIWRFVTSALEKGQERFSVHIFPFRSTRISPQLCPSRRAMQSRQEAHSFHVPFKSQISVARDVRLRMNFGKRSETHGCRRSANNRLCNHAGNGVWQLAGV